jgi:hypothetical protein
VHAQCWPPIAALLSALLARPAVVLSALVVVQAFIGEEVLLLTGFALLFVGVGWLVAQPSEAWLVLPRLGLGLLLAAALATVALAYPLGVQ